MSGNILKPACTQNPPGKNRLRRAARAVQAWVRQFICSLIEIVILFTATAVLVGILLSFLEAFWYLYLQTPVGIKYSTDPSRSSVHLLSQLIKKDIFVFSNEIAASALVVCLTMSAACEILAIRRYFYEGRGLLNRVIWLSLFSAATAYALAHISRVDVQVAFGLAIAPCLCLFSSCLNISNRLLPELTPFAIMAMIGRIKNARHHPGARFVPDAPFPRYPAATGDIQPSVVRSSPSSPKPRRANSAKPVAG